MIQNKQPYAYLVLLLLTTTLQALVSETCVRIASACYAGVVTMIMILFENKHDSTLCGDYINVYDEVAYLVFGFAYTMMLLLISWVTNKLWRAEGLPMQHEYPVAAPRGDDRRQLLEAIDLLRGRGIDDEVDKLEQLAQNATCLPNVPVLPYLPMADTPGKRASMRSLGTSHQHMSTPADCDLYSVLESECQPLSTHDQYQPRESYGMFSLCSPTGDVMAQSYESMNKSYVPMASSFETALEPPDDGSLHSPPRSPRGVPLPSTFGSDYDSSNTSYLVVKHFETLLLDPELIQHLSRGGVLFCMACKLQSDLTESDIRLVECFINMSVFEDEVQEAGTINVNMRGEMELDYTFWRNTAVYYLPGITGDDISAKVISSYEYQKACQPSGTHVWPDVQGEDTFRITKTIIPLVFKITIQFRCSDVPEEFLPALSVHMSGLPVHKAVLMERTKRSKGGLDVCKKCKSLLLYHFLPNGGAIVCNPVSVVNSSIPSVLVAIIDKVGTMGGKEVAVCAKLARKYLSK